MFGSTAHPMRLASIDPATGAVTDLGGVPAFGGGKLCASDRQGGLVVGAEHPHGRLRVHDPAVPFDPVAGNPRWVAGRTSNIARPRTALRIEPRTLRAVELARPPAAMAAGGAIGAGRLRYAGGAHAWSFAMAPVASIALPIAHTRPLGEERA